MLAEDDLRAIQAALNAGREWELERSVIGGVHIRITTGKAGPAWLPWVMLARLEVWRGNVYSTQYCTSAEDLRRGL